MTADDEAIEIVLRAPREVGARLIALAAICRRGSLEEAAVQRALGEEAEAERFDWLAWLSEQELTSQLTEEERRLLETPVGRLSRDDASTATWSAEALVGLAWAAGLIPRLPAPTVAADPAAALSAIPQPWDDPAAFFAGIALRPEEEIAVERERAEVWRWRVEVEIDRRRATGALRDEIETDLRDTAAEAVAAGLLPHLVAGDFAVEERPVRALSEERLAAIASIVTQRLHALNWLCGFGQRWDDVPLDV